jgi:hypothetical protein
MKTLLYLSIFLIFSSTIACGNSPLLNHLNQDNAPIDNGAGTSGQDCPLDFTKSGLCAKLTWDASPAGDQENSFTLHFYNKATGAARDVDNEVSVLLWMPAMGHGSSPVQITALGNGGYSATHVYFVMPGAWEVRVQIKKNHQLVEQETTQVTL